MDAIEQLRREMLPFAKLLGIRFLSATARRPLRSNRRPTSSRPPLSAPLSEPSASRSIAAVAPWSGRHASRPRPASCSQSSPKRRWYCRANQRNEFKLFSRRNAMKLYYSPLSVYSAKPRIAMFEKSIAHETKLVNWTPATGWIKPDELPRLNPKAQIPVLVDGDAVIPDSTIILEYLDERFPKPALYPTGAAERARCRVLEDLGDTLLAPNLGVLVREVLLKPDA